MPNISNDWLKIEPSAGEGNTSATVTILKVNFSRTASRSASITGTTTHGSTAHATITQSAYGPYIDIDHIEDGNGENISQYQTPNTVPSKGDYYKIVGYANVNSLSVEETSNNYTNLNTMYKPTSFILTDQSSVTHTMPLDTEFSPDYGAVDRYMFSIEFSVNSNTGSSQRTISIIVSDGGASQRSASDTISFYQEGTVSENI